MDGFDTRELDELIRSAKKELEAEPGAARQTPPPAGGRPQRNHRAAKPKTRRKAQKPKKSGISFGKKTFIYVAGVLLASMALALFAWTCLEDVCALTRQDQVVSVTVSEGESIAEITEELRQKGLIRYPWLFRLYCDAAHAQRKILPGTYNLNMVFDYHALVNGMASSGGRATVKVTIPEGYTCGSIFSLMEEKGVCSAAALEQAAAEAEFDYAFLEGTPKGKSNRLEGCLFPDTYDFYVNEEPEAVLQKLLGTMDSRLTEEHWAALDALNAGLREKKRSGGFGEGEIEAGDLSMQDILTVASLIEREAANGAECGKIASVIYNRLCSKNYPYLNIDATLLYGLSEHKETLTDEDKELDSPYNTYKNPGLPAGPIACPGMRSIEGALYPEDTVYHFYALNEDGTHTFTETYEEHRAFLENLNHEET